MRREIKIKREWLSLVKKGDMLPLPRVQYMSGSAEKEIRVGLLGVILRDCGITRERFLEV
jgi:hypothetical protein